jgi:hypothetical protein
MSGIEKHFRITPRHGLLKGERGKSTRITVGDSVKVGFFEPTDQKEYVTWGNVIEGNRNGITLGWQVSPPRTLEKGKIYFLYNYSAKGKKTSEGSSS